MNCSHARISLLLRCSAQDVCGRPDGASHAMFARQPMSAQVGANGERRRDRAQRKRRRAAALRPRARASRHGAPCAMPADGTAFMTSGQPKQVLKQIEQRLVWPSIDTAGLAVNGDRDAAHIYRLTGTASLLSIYYFCFGRSSFSSEISRSPMPRAMARASADECNGAFKKASFGQRLARAYSEANRSERISTIGL